MPSIECSNLNESLRQYLNDGYRLDMIMPADSPREVQLSKNGEVVRIVLSSNFNSPDSSTQPAEAGTHDGWTMGRGGMLYRDLMPDRMRGQMAVSHIRLTDGGEIADYVHYHKIEFQMIRCIAGRIKVVYEDQGEPFWLEPGDWVIQPPEIRHRVLECEAGSEVIEISIPDEHETWIDHQMTLPTYKTKPDRDFSGQRFVRYVANHDRD